MGVDAEIFFTPSRPLTPEELTTLNWRITEAVGRSHIG